MAYIHAGTIGVMAMLMGILGKPAFQLAGEEDSIKAFIFLTSPDRLEDPRRGSELWDYLKETFPLVGGGIDGEKISQEMARIYLAEIKE